MNYPELSNKRVRDFFISKKVQSTSIFVAKIHFKVLKVQGTVINISLNTLITVRCTLEILELWVCYKY